jgi:ATP-utilising chromatin assembly and remodelling N-terminal/DDT domain/WSTF, HB1, Itc1p, MBD9 motif 1
VSTTLCITLCACTNVVQKRFICEITGHSGLSFFDAQKSEAIGSQEVESSFPEALREPVLRKVQFSTISRIDNLVDKVFDDFRQDFYPGETVTVVLDDGNRLNGLVREKARFPERRGPDGSLERKAFSRYFVQLITRSDEEALVDDDHIVRDRKAFTKQMLRSFIKNTVTREAWTGAPWLVKPEIAVTYFIDTNVPPQLRYGSKAAERKASAAAKRGEQDGMHQFWASRGLPELKPAIKPPKSKMTSDELTNMKHEQFQEYQRALQGSPTFVLPKASPTTFDLHQYSPTNGTPYYPPLAQLVPKTVPPPPAPAPIKYPIEDLEVAPVRNGTHRPAIHYLSRDTPASTTTNTDTPILMSTVGSLLETWNTLNVYCQVFMLDSFTFDDFMEAMQFSSARVDCELFNEIHCAVLKKLVNGEDDQNGAIQISLPDLPSDDEDEDESDVDESSAIPTPTPEPEEPVKRTTRSSLNKVQAKPATRSPSAAADVRIHRAAEMFGDYGWIQRLRKRDFRNGGWQLIMVGLLHQLAGRPRLQADCDQILTHLAPLDAEPTQQTAWLQYSTMDINMRVKALQIICMLTLETKAIKAFLEESSAQMTELRKIKIEHQRARKEA